MILETIITSIFSMFVLLVLTRMMGYRQISQMSLYDYIIGITIGSICADFAMASFDEIAVPLTATVVYALVTILMSKVTQKSTRIRNLIEGQPLVLFYNQTFYYEHFQVAKIDIDEFLCACRSQGYFDMKDIYLALLESNGKISILPVTSSRPANVQDLNLNIEQDLYTYPIVIDGKINENNLKQIKKDHQWLDGQLKVQGATLQDTFLATYNSKNQLVIYKR